MVALRFLALLLSAGTLVSAAPTHKSKDVSQGHSKDVSEDASHHKESEKKGSEKKGSDKKDSDKKVSDADATTASKKNPGDASGSCTFTDALTANENRHSCTTIVIKDMEVPAGKTLDLTGLKSGTTVVFDGKLTFGYVEWYGPLMSISGTNILVNGTKNHLIDGGGEKWWDCKGDNGGKKKPRLLNAHSLMSSTVTGLKIINTPVQSVSVTSSNNLVFQGIYMDSAAGNDGRLAHNTDAFDVNNSQNLTIRDTIIKNQDDCMAVNSGENILFTNSTCIGGHGISVGSVGLRPNNIVKNVVVSDSYVHSSDNGLRIKSIYNAVGSISNILFKNIVIKDIIHFGVVIRQDYLRGSPNGKPTGGVPITNVTIQNVTGNVLPTGSPIFILCKEGTCKDFKFSGINITGGKKAGGCIGVPKGVSC